MSKISKMNSKASGTEFMTETIKIVTYRSCLEPLSQKKRIKSKISALYLIIIIYLCSLI